MSASGTTTAQINDWVDEYKYTTNEKKKKQLLNLIVIATMPFVKKVAKTLARRTTDPIDDLIQVGSVGLVKAIDLYKSSGNAKFTTFATYVITGEIKHYLRDKAFLIRPSRQFLELAYRINMVTKNIINKGIENPTIEDIAKELSLPIKKVREVIEADRRKTPLSLDAIVTDLDDNQSPLANVISAEDYEETLRKCEEKIMLTYAIEKLPKNLREVIELIYYDEYSYAEVSIKLNLSLKEVAKRVKQALSKIHEIIIESD